MRNLKFWQYGNEKRPPPQYVKKHASNAVSPPIIDGDKAREEWTFVKNVVATEGYPTNDMAALWKTLNWFHKQDIPNFLSLAQLALFAPIHTSDCERAFSAQN